MRSEVRLAPPDPRLGRWSRINRLIAAAAERVGAKVEELSDVHTDHLLRIVHGDRRVIVAKTRSPFLTQVAQSLSNNKYVARQLLREAGVPVVEDALIEFLDQPRDRALAEEMLARHGSLVVKPNWGNRGVGVVTEVRDLPRLERAFAFAVERDADEEVLLERQLPGEHLRVTVIGGRVEAAAIIEHVVLQVPPGGTVQVAVDALNQDPRRGPHGTPRDLPLDQLEADEDFEAYLEVLGLTLDLRTPEGARVPVWTEEQETIDVTDRLHPELAADAVRACNALGVDVGGVDLMVREVERPLGPENGAVLEVNVMPALHLHALPTRGEPRPVFDAFVRHVLGLAR